MAQKKSAKDFMGLTVYAKRGSKESMISENQRQRTNIVAIKTNERIENWGKNGKKQRKRTNERIKKEKESV